MPHHDTANDIQNDVSVEWKHQRIKKLKTTKIASKFSKHLLDQYRKLTLFKNNPINRTYSKWVAITAMCVCIKHSKREQFSVCSSQFNVQRMNVDKDSSFFLRYF